MTTLQGDDAIRVLFHQARCSKLEPSKRESRRDMLILCVGDRELVNEALNDLGLADCFGADADGCFST